MSAHTLKMQPGRCNEENRVKMASPTVILLMGMTGSGKSTFISRLGDPNARIEIGYGLESKTADIECYTMTAAGGLRPSVMLIDTPGFDDTVCPDAEILQRIAEQLCARHRAGLRVAGIIYLHKITSTRLSGTALKNLEILRRFCGTQFHGRVLFATTMWEQARCTPEGERAAVRREDELRREYWDVMFRGHAGVVRHLGDNQRSALSVVNYLLQRLDKLEGLSPQQPPPSLAPSPPPLLLPSPSPAQNLSSSRAVFGLVMNKFRKLGDTSSPNRPADLQIMHEMVDQGRPVEETAAHRYVCAEQRLLKEQKARRLAELEKEAEGVRRRIGHIRQGGHGHESDDDDAHRGKWSVVAGIGFGILTAKEMHSRLRPSRKGES